MNIYYAFKLFDLAQVSDNCNEKILEKMLKNFMKDYDTNYKILRQKIKFKNKILKKRIKVANSMQKAELNHELRKIRYVILRRKIENLKKYFKFRKDYKANKEDCKKLDFTISKE